MFSNRLLLTAVGSAVIAIAAPIAIASSGTGMPQPPGDRDRLARINDRMGLAHSSLLRLDVAPGEMPETLVLVVNDMPMVVKLEEHSVRHPDFRVFTRVDDGSLVEVAPPPVNTMRGRIIGLDDAVVSGSVEAQGLHLRLALPGGTEFWIEPLTPKFPDAAEDEYVLYNISDVLDCEGKCAVDAPPEALRHQPFFTGMQQSGSGGVAGSVKVAEIACDADFEYYQYWGSSVSNVVDRINSIINSNNVLYEAQTGLTHEITTIIVQTSSNQPYTQTNASNLLSQFRNHWNANHGNIPRDLAHLFTGKNLNSNTIGVAYLGVVCNIPWAYALSQSDFSPNFACVTDLTAHEIGHNWNAPHCSCPNHTMNSWITCANNFHSSSISAIVSYANSVTCLSDGGSSPPPGTGACCVANADGSIGCNEMTQANCAEREGEYHGDGTSCANITCSGGEPPACPDGEIEDCNGNCAPASWVGDGICDDGSYSWNGVPIYFNCDEFDCDGGDCICDDPVDPTTMSVSSISISTVNVGQGNRKGQAVVTIVNDLGVPVQGASVTGTFSGDFNETHTAPTNAQGQATLLTNATKKGNIKFSFCVTNVTHPDLSYVPGDNNVTCAE